MALVNLRTVLDKAAEHNCALPAFNVNNLEQIKAILKAADKANSAVILQASRGARKYAGDNFLKHLIMAAVEEYPHLPIVMHLDHGNNFEVCESAVNANFTSVMMDGSLTEDGKPASFEYNAGITKKVAEFAHKHNVSVEGEIGCLGSLETGEGEKEDGHGFDGKLDTDMLLTSVDEAVEFVKQTNVDALAIAVGTSHGAYKFTRKPDGEILALDRIKEIHEALPNTHLVMHGSSSVPQELQDLINAHGGEMPQTYGVPVEQLQESIKMGVRKINIDTDNRMAMTGTIRKVLQENPEAFDPRKYLEPAVEEMEKLCYDRYIQFGCKDLADRF
tara:strand:+ start:372 stop:1367 length:996 start_codon:yes stop_codon:yes gene_type:complete